ncbi:MAG: ComEC/Rec2-related protein [Parcubacteria group bacterium]|nr:ComEC/Rec2-related protein [Parcubacteria group bacterium]
MSLLVSICGGFASGVFLRSLFFDSWYLIIFFVFIAALLGAVTFLKPRQLYVLALLFFLSCSLGMLRTSVTDSPLPQKFATHLKERVAYQGVVVADPDVRDSNQRVEIEISRGREKTIMLAVAPRSPELMVGDHVWVSGTLDVPQPFETDGGRVFRYDKYLERDGVRFILNFAYIRIDSPAPWYSLPAALARVKHTFLNGVRTSLPEPYASLAGGVVIGGKSGLGTDLKNDFIRSGLIQIIVLSGYNVMVVAEWVMSLLALTKLPKRLRAVAGAVALLLFVGIAGFSATALRAALMACIALYARATGRTYAAGRALLVVILLMLMWNPLYLVFDPGFGLSVTATAGLIWLAPIIEQSLQRFQKSSASSVFWISAIATTLAAQSAVLPLLLYDTGNLSLVAIPANLITSPIVPLAMGLSALAGIAGMVFGHLVPIMSIVTGYPAYLANAYLIYVAQKAAELPFAAFTLPLFPFWLVLAAYAALVFFASSKRFSTTPQLRFAKKASI